MQTLQELKERGRERQSQKEDMDVNFGLEVAGRLKRLKNRQNALAKLKIQQVLFNREFQGEDGQQPYCGNQFEF